MNFVFCDIVLRMLNLLKHVFYYRNTMFFEGTAVRKMDETCKTHARNVCLKSVRKIHDIWTNNKPKKGHLKRPKAYIFRDMFACDFRNVFEVIFGSKMAPKRDPKCDEKSIKIDSAPGWHFGTIFE